MIFGWSEDEKRKEKNDNMTTPELIEQKATLERKLATEPKNNKIMAPKSTTLEALESANEELSYREKEESKIKNLTDRKKDLEKSAEGKSETYDLNKVTAELKELMQQHERDNRKGSYARENDTTNEAELKPKAGVAAASSAVTVAKKAEENPPVDKQKPTEANPLNYQEAVWNNSDKPPSKKPVINLAAIADNEYGFGNTGKEVEFVQDAIKVEKDGNFGYETKRKLQEIQEANGLDPDGIVGVKTMALLASGNFKNPNIQGATNVANVCPPSDTGNNPTLLASSKLPPK